ncbi:MAG: Polymorphic membrane protein [uncultured bacterium]|nr:MAG: Polymorphic membrane protein [uncultured bacterium]
MSASAFPWNPSVPSGSVRAIVADDTNVYIGGAFNQVNTEVRNNFAVFGPVRVGFTDTSSESEEETTPANIEVSLSEEAAENVTVEFDAIGGTAAEGVDFTLPVSPLTISAGNTSVNIPVTIINNYVVENDKTIILEISSPTGAILGDNTLHTFTILNTDRSGILAPTINPPPSQPIAKYPQTMSKTSIRWNFYDTASNETGYRLSEIIDGSERIIFETGPEVVTNLLYLDETGLAPGTQYCNRYVIEFNGSGSSRATQLPCATTFPETIIETGETKTPNIVVNQEAFVVTEPNTVSASAASQAKTAASLTLVIAMFGLAHASYKRANLCSTKECKKMFSRYLLTALVSGAVVIAILRITAMPNPQAASFEPISQQTILKKYDHIKFIFTISNTGEATADDLVFRNSLPQEMKLVPQTTNLTKNNSITESISSDAYNKIAINIDNLLSNETSVVTFDATMASHLALFDNFGAVSGSNFPDTLSTGLPIYIDTSAIVTAPIIPSGKEIKPFDLIKTENEPAIYMVDVDYTRRPFLNERDLLSWYPSMTWAYIVSKTDMASIKIGHPMLYRPGTWLVKTQTNPAVYAVSQGNVLHWIPNETVAKELYGQLWNKKIVDVEDTMFSLYTIGGHVGNGQYPNNAVVNYRTSICYMQNEFCRPITTSGIRENRIFAEFILTVPIGSFSLPPEGTMIFDKEINLLSD